MTIVMKCIIGKRREMTKKRYIESLLLTALSALAFLVVGCSDVDDGVMPPVIESEGEPLQVSHFTRYGIVDGTNETDYADMTMWLFAIPKNNEKEKPQAGIVAYNGISDDDGSLSWNSSIYVKNATEYEMYGFLPWYIADAESSVSGNNLTLKGLNPLSKEDVCIITGVKNGGYPADQLLPGSYTYTPIYEVDHLRYGVQLLVDHIYASLTFSIYIDGDYNTRRTIKLKKLEVQSKKHKALVDAVITLDKFAGTAVPFTFSTLTERGEDKASQVIFEDAEGQEIKTVAAVNSMETAEKDFYRNMVSPLYFGDWLKDDLYLVSTYDVYDQKGNLTRENCTATNKLPSSKTNLSYGQRESITLTVNPSYLYVLSDPDQDPQVVIK